MIRLFLFLMLALPDIHLGSTSKDPYMIWPYDSPTEDIHYDSLSLVVEGVEALTFKADGTLLWRGRLVTTDKELVKALREFLRSGCKCKCEGKDAQD